MRGTLSLLRTQKRATAGLVRPCIRRDEFTAGQDPPWHIRASNGVMKQFLALLLALACGTTAGCGLLFVPEAAERPAPALRTVEVVDAVTGEPVTTADIVLARVPWSNYMRPHPWAWWGVAQSADGAVRRLAPDTDPADVPRSRPARHLGRGWFEIAPHEEWTWQQVLFPFGVPLGFVMYHTRQAHLVVSAPGYRAVWVSDPWMEAADDLPVVRFEFGPAEPAQPGPSVRANEAGLRVALPPRSLPTRAPRWQWDRPGQRPDTAPPGPDGTAHEGADG